MSEFKFNCPHCEQPLEAPAEMLGQQINCPSCNGTITLPALQPTAPAAAAPPPSPQNQTRACPFCGEAILLAAVKCKHCGEFLDGRNRQAAAAPPPPQPKKSRFQVENDLWKGNPSYLYYLGHFIFGIILLPVGIGLLFIVYALLDRNTKHYTLTNKRVMSKAGIISRKIHEVGVRDIRNINVKQGILERLFGIGTVDIASAGTAGIEVSFAGIRDPMRARDLIRREKDEADNRD